MAVCTLFSGKNTNSPPAGIMSPILPRSTGGTPVAPVAVTPEEIAQGWRVVAETNCDANVYVMPDGVSPSFNWHRRGTFGEWSRLDLGDFAFPLGTNDETFSSLSVFNDGRIRPTPRDEAREICAVGVPMLAMQGASRFWWADSATAVAGRPPYQSKLLTWENFFLHADTNAPVNAQIELFTNGDFITRSNALERIHRRVASFDWDGDGLENSVDPEPLVAGTDAHGTNAEWYNVVCSNVLEAAAATSAALPPELTWREGVNSNAYYFVDVVTECGPTPIYFTGDHDTRLGNPVVVALAGATNRVPLLIGVNYAVTSDTPFAVSFPVEYVHPTVTTNGVSDYNVRWPLNFVFTECLGESNRVYTVTVEPYDPGGVFEWEDSGGGVPMRGGPSGGGVPMRGGPSGGCDCMTCDTNSVCFSCSSSKTCETGSAAHGSYILDTTSFSVEGGECRCGFDDPPPGSPPSSHKPNDPSSLTINFSKPAVIFEETYLDCEYVAKPKLSTRVQLTVSAYGGTHGGSLSLSTENLDKLSPVVGGQIDLPAITNISPQETFFSTCVYEAVAVSDSLNDIKVLGTFTENETGVSSDTNSNLTAVKLEFTPDYLIDNYPHRHRVGVREAAKCSWMPTNVTVTCEAGTGGHTNMENGKWNYDAPLTAGASPYLTAVCQGSRYTFALEVVEPESVIAKSVDAFDYGVPPNVAGGAGMELELVVLPTNVSFMGIAVQEVPTDYKDPQGYFANGYFDFAWSHTTNMNAGIWHNIQVNNVFMHDYAEMGDCLPNMTPTGEIAEDNAYGWIAGTMNWHIPVGWNQRDSSLSDTPVEEFCVYWQRFRMASDGTLEVEKLANVVQRKTNTVVRLNGKIVPLRPR